MKLKKIKKIKSLHKRSKLLWLAPTNIFLGTCVLFIIFHFTPIAPLLYYCSEILVTKKWAIIWGVFTTIISIGAYIDFGKMTKETGGR